MQAFDFVAPLLQKLPEQEAQKCATVVANICKPEQCWLDFFVPEASEAGILQEEGEEQEEAPAAILGANKLNSLKAEFNKATGALLELLVDLMRGEYLADCRTLAKENVKLAQAVSEVAVQAVPADDQQDSSSCSSLGFVKNLYLVVQAYDTNTKSVSLAAPLPTPSLIQSLNPSISSEQDAAGRARAWKQVQSECRKFVTFSVVPKYTKEALNSAFRNSGKVWAHKGDLNTSHRLIVGSADLVTETSQEPWLTPSAPAADAWKALAGFCMGLAGNTDFIFLFDGRMREIRRIHAPCLDEKKLPLFEPAY